MPKKIRPPIAQQPITKAGYFNQVWSRFFLDLEAESESDGLQYIMGSLAQQSAVKELVAEIADRALKFAFMETANTAYDDMIQGLETKVSFIEATNNAYDNTLQDIETKLALVDPEAFSNIQDTDVKIYGRSETVRTGFDNTGRNGVVSGAIVTDEGGLNISITAGVVFLNKSLFDVDAIGTTALTDNAINYIYATKDNPIIHIEVAHPTGEFALRSVLYTYAGDIHAQIDTPLMSGGLRDSLWLFAEDMFPVACKSGCAIAIDTDATFAHDFTIGTGSYYVKALNKYTIESIIYSAGSDHAESNVEAHFHTASEWDTGVLNGVDFDYWDNGTQKVAVTNNKWYCGFIYVHDSTPIYVYPQNEHHKESMALEEALTYPPYHQGIVMPVARFIFRGGATAFNSTAYYIDIRPFFGTGGGEQYVQNVYKTVNGDTGSTTASASDDVIDIVGTTPLSSNVTADNVNLSMLVATNAQNGYMTSALVEDIETNNGKITNATHTGDVTGAMALTITSDAVTYDKMQDVSATNKLLGRSTAGAGAIEEIPLTAAGRALIDDADAVAQRATLDVDQAGTDNSTDVTLHASAMTGGLSLTDQEISNRAATNAQTGYATDVHITAIEANTAKDTNVSTTLEIGTKTGTTVAITSDGGTDDVILPAATTTEAGLMTEAQFGKLAGIATGADVTDYDDTKISNAILENNLLTISKPLGASYSTSASPATGAIKITLPQSWTDTMMQFNINVYEYTSGLSFTLNVGGYTYTNSSRWINTSANLSGSTLANNRVRFGHDGTKCCIYIGETTSEWSYPKVSVTNFQAGFVNYSKAQWETGWSISITTTIGTVTSDISDSLIGANSLLNQSNLTIQANGAVDVTIGSTAGDDFTVNTDKLVVEGDSGSIGIGTTTPAAKLAINGGVHVGGDSDPGDNNLLVDGTGNFTGALTAASYADNTPGYEGAAVIELKKVKTVDGKIDHSSLPSIAQVDAGQITYEKALGNKVIIDQKDAFDGDELKDGVKFDSETKEYYTQETIVIEKHESKPGRDLGAMISVLTVAVQELAARIEKLEGVI